MTAEQQAEIRAWWRALDADERRELREDLRTRRTKERRSVEVLALAVDPEAIRELEEDRETWREFATNHPEIFDRFEVRTVHICTAHPDALAAVERGVIREDFRCPYAHAACPIRASIDAAGRRALVVLAPMDEALSRGAPMGV